MHIDPHVVRLFEQLMAAHNGLGPRDFGEFAKRVEAFNPTLGAVLKLQSDTADAGTPDLHLWLIRTAKLAWKLEERGITSPAEARLWWWRLRGLTSAQIETEIRRSGV